MNYVETTIPASRARKELFGMLEKISGGLRYTITQNGYPKAVVLSADEFESWVETLEVASEFPDLLQDIKKARTEYKKGDYITLEDLLKKYELQGGVNKTSRKRVCKN